YEFAAIFVGYNHHRELVIFGSALLFDEKTETFEWLFNQFKECMRGQKPTNIFTDQAPAIAAGIQTQFPLPDTFHGLCTFHIHQNASKNLGSLCDSAFVAELNYLMFGVDDDIEFEENWEKMIATCFPGKGPEGHPCLTQIYTKKRQWSRAWVQYHFTCGMRSSQLSESCNSNLRHYLKPSLTLIEFFNQFIRLVENKREKQLQRDFQMISGAYPNWYAYLIYIHTSRNTEEVILDIYMCLNWLVIHASKLGIYTSVLLYGPN
ncbi:Protein FAR-RED IMPAIRED RESPONSE 1, partial [Linum perenne]